MTLSCFTVQVNQQQDIEKYILFYKNIYDFTKTVSISLSFLHIF